MRGESGVSITNRARVAVLALLALLVLTGTARADVQSFDTG